MILRFWDTYLVPWKNKFFEKIEKVNEQIDKWDKEDTDVICLQEIYRWRTGLFSYMFIAPLARMLDSRLLLCLTISDGKHQLSTMGSVFITIALWVLKYYMSGLLLITAVIFQNNSFMSHFDTLSYLKIPKKYKYISRSSKNKQKDILTSGKLTLSRFTINEHAEIVFNNPSHYTNKDSFIRTTVINNIRIYNIYLTRTRTSRWKNTRYGMYKLESQEDTGSDTRNKQVEKICGNINKDMHNIVLGNFNVCKYADNEEFFRYVTKFKEKNLKQVIPGKGAIDYLESNGTFRHVYYRNITKERHREYLDHVFSSVKNTVLEFDKDFVDKMPHKAGLLKVPVIFTEEL